jgi:hypothetical protein
VTDVVQPLAPKVNAALIEATAKRNALAEKVNALALAEFTGAPGSKRERQQLSMQLSEADAEIARLEAALQQALVVDEANENASTLAGMRAGLAELQLVCGACTRAAADLDQAAGAIVDSWKRLQAAIELVRLSVPPNCSLPRGLADPDLAGLVKGLLYKHSAISAIGGQPFPGSEAPSFDTAYDASAIATASTVVGNHVQFVLRTMQHQVSITEDFYNGEEAA